jgi:hypothetical protein
MANKHLPLPPLVKESAMDYAEHEKTYSAFVSAVKWAILISAATVVVLYFLVIR